MAVATTGTGYDFQNFVYGAKTVIGSSLPGDKVHLALRQYIRAVERAMENIPGVLAATLPLEMVDYDTVVYPAPQALRSSIRAAVEEVDLISIIDTIEVGLEDA